MSTISSSNNGLLVVWRSAEGGSEIRNLKLRREEVFHSANLICVILRQHVGIFHLSRALFVTANPFNIIIAFIPIGKPTHQRGGGSELIVNALHEKRYTRYCNTSKTKPAAI